MKLPFDDGFSATISSMRSFDAIAQQATQPSMYFLRLRDTAQEARTFAIQLAVERWRGPLQHLARESQERMAQVRQACKQWSRDAQITQKYLADRGWYMPAAHLHMGLFRQIREMIELGRGDEVESFLRGLARSRIPTVLEGAQRHWPDRWVFIRDALEAHRTNKFTLSIPTLLAQADGIAHELFDVPLFGKKAGEPKTKEALARRLERHKLLHRAVPLDDATQTLFDPLREVSILLVDTNKIERLCDPTSESPALNRHGVLHGRDLAYHTEANSLRAVSLIAYLIEVHELLLGHEEHVQKCARIINYLGAKSLGSAQAGINGRN